jgi:hypothetical protein
MKIIMRTLKYLSLVILTLLFISCEKNEIKFDCRPAGNAAEFQLHYMVPVVATAANYITRVEVNGQLISNSTNILTTYNGIPGGAVGRFYTADPGATNVKMYFKGKINVDSLVYDQNATLTTGKQNVFVHSFTQPPVVLENGYPFESNTTTVTDSTAWVKFYNFLYETSGVPTTLRIQYQYLDTRTNLPVNIGSPLYFGETTGWQPVTVVKTDKVSAGSRTVYFNMRVIDASGIDQGKLKTMNTSGSFVDYSDYWTLFIGRRYHHIFAGFRAVKSPNSSIKVFTAL